MVRTETFRRWALACYGVHEEPHFQKTSFRVGNRIFATLDAEKKSASLKLTLITQSVYVRADPHAFQPAPGAWGRQGWTTARLSQATSGLVKDALLAAYNELTERN